MLHNDSYLSTWLLLQCTSYKCEVNPPSVTSLCELPSQSSSIFLLLVWFKIYWHAQKWDQQKGFVNIGYDCKNQNCIHCYLNIHQSADLDRQVLALPCLFCTVFIFSLQNGIWQTSWRQKQIKLTRKVIKGKRDSWFGKTKT